MPRVLIVDDEKMVRWSLGQALEGAGHQVTTAVDIASGMEALRQEVPDVLLLDYRLPDGTGIDLLQKLPELAPLLPVVMITAHASIGGAVEAIKGGAYDYISKPFDLDMMIQTVERAIETGRLREKLARQHEQSVREFGVQNIVAASPAMQEVVRLVERVGRSEASTVLVTGETGVGKGLIARALHAAGSNWDSAFMHITCTALTETLLESELFGHERGAFTDARRQKKGLIELANGGTVFLDEIGDISPGLQGRLLRFLEDRVFRRVGGTRDLTVDVRVVTATNKDLEERVRLGQFRNDLYFRLNVIPIHVPPLRVRPEDVVPLTERFIEHFRHEFRSPVSGVTPAAREVLSSYHWPGNVRELRNAIERAVLLGDHELLDTSDLPRAVRHGTAGAADPDTSARFDLPSEGVVLAEIEQDLLEQALKRARGNRTRAARLLGMNRDQIRYRIEKFGIDSPPMALPMSERSLRSLPFRRVLIGWLATCAGLSITGCDHSSAQPHPRGDFLRYEPPSVEQTIHVPPPELSEGVFPCSDCHEVDLLPPNPTRRQLVMAHQEVVLRHDEEHRWCLDCHDADDRDQLRLASGTLVPFEESYRLCGQCHGDKYRDWRAGIHGRRTGHWDGEKTYLLCVHCHDSHAPAFEPLTPEPRPVAPERTR